MRATIANQHQRTRFWNPDRTVRFDRKNLEPFHAKKSGTRTDHGPTVRFCEPWLIFEVRMVSFCFSFSGEFWPIHRYEVMIRSRRNERARRRIRIGRRSDNFRSWTKGFVWKKKKKNQRRRRQVPQKKKRKKKNTMKQDLCLVEAAASRLPTQLPITPSSFAVISSSFFFFFFFSFFFPLMEITL